MTRTSATNEHPFPEICKILDSRRTMIGVLQHQLGDKEAVDKGPILLIHGGSRTGAFARTYRDIMLSDWTQHVVLKSLNNAPDEAEALALADWVIGELKQRRCPRLIAYVGGQTVADSAKIVVRKLRDAIDTGLYEGAPKHVYFGGIITALSSDGVFSSTSSVRDENGMPKSYVTAAPEFVVGHRLTLLNQPYQMKVSVVADVVTKLSSIWDYDYGCRVLAKYRHDLAVDLGHTACEVILRGGNEGGIDRDYLFAPESIDALFRAVQLCGLSMQLVGSSETASGAEHVGQKNLDEFILEYNELGTTTPIEPLTHGAAVLPMSLVCLYLQGQAAAAEQVKDLADAIRLPYRTKDLGISPDVLKICLAIGIGYRCPRYLAHLLLGDTIAQGDQEERLTVLEEIEFDVLPSRIKAALCDAEVADPSEFGCLGENELQALERVVHRSYSRTRAALEQVIGSDRADCAIEKVRSVIDPCIDRASAPLPERPWRGAVRRWIPLKSWRRARWILRRTARRCRINRGLRALRVVPREVGVRAST